MQTDIITKLGLLDYYDVAWKTSQYGRIWEYLRKDFDVEVLTPITCLQTAPPTKNQCSCGGHDFIDSHGISSFS